MSKLNELLLHEDTRKLLQNFLARPTHALMLLGEEGSGKETLANVLSSEILGTTLDKLESYSYFKKLWPLKQSIRIDEIRVLHSFLQLRTTGKAEYRRIATIFNAHLMTKEAQNALLKILEEPPADTILILTAVGNKSLLPTIYSRTQLIPVKQPTIDAAMSYFGSHGYDEQEIRRNYLLSGGSAGLLSSLLSEASDHALVNTLKTAKTIFASPVFSRLAQIESLAKDKDNLPSLLYSFKKVAKAYMVSGGDQRGLRSLRAIYECEESYKHTPNIKLMLTNLFLQM